MTKRVKVARMALLYMLAGCAGATRGSQTQATPQGQSRSMLTQAQLTATNSENLFDAISKLHSDWLTSRGPTSVTDPSLSAVTIYMNGVNLGKVEALRDIRVLDVTEVRYWDAGQAAARFGMGHPRGVIEITRK